MLFYALRWAGCPGLARGFVRHPSKFRENLYFLNHSKDWIESLSQIFDSGSLNSDRGFSEGASLKCPSWINAKPKSEIPNLESEICNSPYLEDSSCCASWTLGSPIQDSSSPLVDEIIT